MSFLKSAMIAWAVLLAAAAALGASYHIDPSGGNDANSGLAPELAWATLDRANLQALSPGDEILLKRGERFSGKLFLNKATGTAENPIMVAAYGEGALPLIDASGYLAGVNLRDCQHVEVRDLEITADGGMMVDGSPEGERSGVLINTSGNGNTTHFITVRNLFIHDVYPGVDTPHEGKNPTTYLGYGIWIRGGNLNSSNLLVEGCRIERVGFKAIAMAYATRIDVLDNMMKDIGGPAIQASRANEIVVRGNTVDGSGSYVDPRMHGRGSGIWPWTCEDVLIEKNRFMHARGRHDSCGMHIDFNCRDVIVQYNLSVDNEGGFVEVLGNNHNCTYRYNISINDGARVKGVNGASSDGRILWTAGWVGRNNPANGPYNTYIYNNTIYTKSDQIATFSFNDTTDGLLIANNIFYIEGTTRNGSNAKPWTPEAIGRVVFRNNLYQRTGIIPEDLPFADSNPILGDPGFANLGGLAPEDYIPASTELIEDRGIFIPKIPGDTFGLKPGLRVATDFFGNPIVGAPDLGAIELGGTTADLRNISTRGLLGSGDDVIIAGFVIKGESTQDLLIRASGQTLGTLGVSNVVDDTVLTVFDASGTEVASNINWEDGGNSAEIAAAATAVGAFDFSAGSTDSALLLSLPPGSYTAQVRGNGGATGVALVEVYYILTE